MKVRVSAVETSSPSRLAFLVVCVAIIALIWIVFGQTLTHDFVNYDDKVYVYGNPLVSAGLSLHGLLRTFVDTQTNNWHPLTIISHMIDCQIYGLKPGGHHLTNVLLHSIAAVLLFFWLRNITAKGQSTASAVPVRLGPRTSDWSSAFVTALFAVHPLRVESVAWIAERKDVLSAVFFFLTLSAYLRYARVQSFGRYLTMSILFACGLMSKPMLVTTPAVMLLLDYWPLKRIVDMRSFWRMTLEKLPLFGLSLASSIVAFVLQVQSPVSLGQLPFVWRFPNALVTYVTYIWQIFWPANLAVFYPHPDNRLALWQVLVAAAFLIGTTWLVFVLRRNRPYLLVGWLWYLIMLLPVIGIVEVGLQGHADRYTYLPHVGLYIALIWLAVDISRSLPRGKEILAIAGSLVLIILSACAWKQTTYWRNSEALWRHTLAVTKDNDVAHTNLGDLLMDRGELDDALTHLQTALDIRSSTLLPHYDLSFALILTEIGNVLARKGRTDDGIAYFRQAIEFQPNYPDAHYNLGTALFRKGDFDGAIAQWRTTLSISPNDPGTNAMLANALVQKGLLREAADHYQKALKSEPESQVALNNLAWLMAAGPDDSLRDGTRAVQLALKLNRVTQQNNPFFIRTLAAAYAEAEQFENAVETGQSASGLAHVQGQHALAAQIQEETDLYRQHRPLRDQTLKNASNHH